MVQQGAGVGAPCPALPWAFPVARRCLGSPDLLTGAWSWGGPGSLVLLWERCEKMGLVVVETLMEPGKEEGREEAPAPLWGASCLLLSCSVLHDQGSRV